MPRKNYNITSVLVTTMLKDNTIHFNTKDSFTKIGLVRGALSMAGLKNLLDGHIPKQISNELTNIGGFTKRRQI